MEVQRHSQPQLIDLEGPTQPGNEDAHRGGIRIGQLDRTVGLGSLARVQGKTEEFEISAAQCPDERLGLDAAPLDLLELADVERVGLLVGVAAVARFRDEIDITDPHGDRSRGDVELIVDFPKGPRLRP